jgi:hypothetical protein
MLSARCRSPGDGCLPTARPEKANTASPVRKSLLTQHVAGCHITPSQRSGAVRFGASQSSVSSVRSPLNAHPSTRSRSLRGPPLRAPSNHESLQTRLHAVGALARRPGRHHRRVRGPRSPGAAPGPDQAARAAVRGAGVRRVRHFAHGELPHAVGGPGGRARRHHRRRAEPVRHDGRRQHHQCGRRLRVRRDADEPDSAGDGHRGRRDSGGGGDPRLLPHRAHGHRGERLRLRQQPGRVRDVHGGQPAVLPLFGDPGPERDLGSQELADRLRLRRGCLRVHAVRVRSGAVRGRLDHGDARRAGDPAR